MTNPRLTVLAVGATGSIGCLVVEEALREGHAVRALVRTADKARLSFPAKRRWSSVMLSVPTRFPVRWTVSTLSCSHSARTELERWGLRTLTTAACATSYMHWVRGQPASR